MNYLIKWQFTKDNPSPFKTQIEIIKSNFIPLLEDGFFQEKKYSFYITRMWGQDVRLAVFVEEKNLKDVQEVVKSHMNGLILHPFDFDERNQVWTAQTHDWDGEARVSEYAFSENPSPNEYFHTKYLEDIAWIGTGIHKGDLVNAIKFAVRARFETTPYGNLDPKEVFHSYFREISERYRNKNNDEIDKFWGNNGYYYTGSSSPGAHFFYNIALGSDYVLSQPIPNTNERERIINSITQQMLLSHGFNDRL